MCGGSKNGRGAMDFLSMTNVNRGSGPVQGLNLQLPFNRNRRWYIASGFVASLILQPPHNGEHLPVSSERAPEL